MKRYQIVKSFKQLSKNHFYHRFASETEDKQASALLMDSAQLRELLPHVSDSGWQQIFESAESIQTVTGVKRLATYANYLFWIRTDPGSGSSRDHETHFGTDNVAESQKHKTQSTERVWLEGYALLEGCYIDVRDETRAGSSITPQGLDQYLKKHLSPSIAPKARAAPAEPVLNTSIDKTCSLLGEDSPPAAQTPNMSMRSHGKTPFMCKIYKQKDGPASEVLFFQSRDQLEVWRQRIGLCLALFQDFEKQYNCCLIVAKEGRKHTVVLQNKYSGQKYIGHCRSLGHNYSQKDLLSAKNKILNEAALLRKLGEAKVAPNLKELQFTGNSFLLIAEFFEAKTFRDWFSEIWCVENQDCGGTGKVVNLLVDLSLLLLAVHSLEVAHGNISQDTIMIKCAAGSPLKLGDAQFQFNDAISGIVNSSQLQRRNSAFKLVNSKIQNSPSQSGISAIVASRPAQQTTRAKYMLVGFWDAKDMSSCHYKPAMHNPGIGTYIETQSISKDNWTNQSFAEDVLEMGKIFFDILFGININQAKQRDDCVENEFVKALLLRPSDLIFTRDPLYEVNPKILEMVARMLSPDVCMRPTIRECYSEIMSASREDHRSKNYARQSSPRRNTVISRLSLDSYQSRISSGNRPSVVVGEALMKGKPKVRKNDSGTLMSLELSLKFTPRKKNELCEEVFMTDGNLKPRSRKQLGLGRTSEHTINLSVGISSKRISSPGRKKKPTVKLDLSHSLNRLKLSDPPKPKPVQSKEFLPQFDSGLWTERAALKSVDRVSHTQRNQTDESNRREQYNAALTNTRKVPLSVEVAHRPWLSNKKPSGAQCLKNTLSFGGDTPGVPETPSFTRNKPLLEIQSNPFATPPTVARRSPKVAVRLSLRSRSQTPAPGKEKITQHLTLKFLPASFRPST